MIFMILVCYYNKCVFIYLFIYFNYTSLGIEPIFHYCFFCPIPWVGVCLILLELWHAVPSYLLFEFTFCCCAKATWNGKSLFHLKLYCPSSREAKAETQSRNLKIGPETDSGGVLLVGLLSRTTYPRYSNDHLGHIKKMPRQTLPQANWDEQQWCRQLLRWGSSFLGDSNFCWQNQPAYLSV